MSDQLLNLADCLSPEELRLVELSLHLVTNEDVIEEWELQTLLGWNMPDVVGAHTQFFKGPNVTRKTLSIAIACMSNICGGPKYISENALDHSKLDLDALRNLTTKLHCILKEEPSPDHNHTADRIQ